MALSVRNPKALRALSCMAMPLVGWTLLPAPCAAQSGQQAAAEATFQKGRTLLEANRVSEACQQYEASLDLELAVGTLLHLADCYERLGRTASAWATFEKARSRATATGQDARAEIAAKQAAELQPRLARIELRASDGPSLPGLVVRVGDVLVPAVSLGVPLPFDPGTQIIRVTAPGHRPWTSRATVEPGGLEVVHIPPLSIEPRPVSEKPISASTFGYRDSAPGEDRGTRGGGQRTLGLIVGGVGLAGLVGGSALGVQAHLKNESSQKQCRPGDERLCNEGGIALRSEAQDFALASTIALSAGGGLVVTGLVLYLTAPSGKSAQTAGFVPAFDGQRASLNWWSRW